jgi:hypothetical protein
MAVDLFPGENLVFATDAWLSIDESESVHGAVFLTDLRVVWTPLTPLIPFQRRSGNAMSPEANVVTLGEIRRAESSWQLFQSPLILHSPGHRYRFRDHDRSFRKWVAYILANAPHLDPEGDSASPSIPPEPDTST